MKLIGDNGQLESSVNFFALLGTWRLNCQEGFHGTDNASGTGAFNCWKRGEVVLLPAGESFGRIASIY